MEICPKYNFSAEHVSVGCNIAFTGTKNLYTNLVFLKMNYFCCENVPIFHRRFSKYPGPTGKMKLGHGNDGMGPSNKYLRNFTCYLDLLPPPPPFLYVIRNRNV